MIDLRELRKLAENARSEQETWWLWDDPPGSHEFGSLLAFASQATPEVVLSMIARIEELEVEDAKFSFA